MNEEDLLLYLQDVLDEWSGRVDPEGDKPQKRVGIEASGEPGHFIVYVENADYGGDQVRYAAELKLSRIIDERKAS